MLHLNHNLPLNPFKLQNLSFWLHYPKSNVTVSVHILCNHLRGVGGGGRGKARDDLVYTAGLGGSELDKACLRNVCTLYFLKLIFSGHQIS